MKMKAHSPVLIIVYSILLFGVFGMAVGDGRTTTRYIGCFKSNMVCDLPAPALVPPINNLHLNRTVDAIGNCDLCLVVSNNRATPNVVYCSQIITVLPFGVSFCLPNSNADSVVPVVPIVGAGPINGGMFG